MHAASNASQLKLWKMANSSASLFCKNSFHVFKGTTRQLMSEVSDDNSMEASAMAPENEDYEIEEDFSDSEDY